MATFVNAFTEAEGLALLANKPDVVKALSKADEGYKAFFIGLSNKAGSAYVETLESDGKFDVNGDSVSFATLAFVALSGMALTGFSASRNDKTQPMVFDTVISAKEIIKSITVASEGKYYLYDDQKEVGYSGLRAFVEVLLQGNTVAQALELCGDKFAGFKAAGDAIRQAKAAVKK
jgi:hypothetical protein